MKARRENRLLTAFRRGCRPLLSWDAAEYADCNTRLICQRCGFCVLHCRCAPAELRMRHDGRRVVYGMEATA